MPRWPKDTTVEATEVAQVETPHPDLGSPTAAPDETLLRERARCTDLVGMVAARGEVYARRLHPIDIAEATAWLIHHGYTGQDAPTYEERELIENPPPVVGPGEVLYSETVTDPKRVWPWPNEPALETVDQPTGEDPNDPLNQ